MRQTEYWNTVAEEKNFTTVLDKELFSKYVSKDAKILDVGCGYGRILNELHQEGYTDLTGIDSAENMIKRGIREYPHLNLISNIDGEINFPDNTFDAVILFGVLTCVPDDASQKLLIESIKNVLKPNGIIYVCDFLLNTGLKRRMFYKKHQKEFGTYGTFRTYDGVVVRHHDEKYISDLLSDFEQLEYKKYVFATMNGSESNGFAFVGNVKSDVQNIYDNDTFFEGYKKLRESENNYNDLLEQPAMAKILPDLSGKKVLDLGCGYGHNCIDFVKRGAEKVIGIDISEKMLSVAKTESSHEKIKYLNMSMTDISTLAEKFDFIYSSLAFHYVKDFDTFAKNIFSVLNEGGQLLFSQEHPIITATIDGNGHFNKDKNGNRVSYTFSNYNEPGERKVHWYVDGVVKYHRTISDVINALAKAGFVIEEVCEPVPEDWAVEKLPTIVKEYIKPNFLVVKSRKV